MEIDLKKLLRLWLSHQCRMMTGITRAVVLVDSPQNKKEGSFVIWPEDKTGYDTLDRIARTALAKGKAVVKAKNNKIQSTGEPLDAMACPLFLEGEPFGVVALEMTSRSKLLQEATVQQIQTGTKWLEAMILQQATVSKNQLLKIIDLIAAALEQDQFQKAVSGVVNELSEKFSCQRVSLGFLRRNRIRLEATSHSSEIDPQSNMARAIEDAMSESLDQQTTLVYPELEDSIFATHFHAQLSTTQKGSSICTVPLIKNNKAVGVLLLERDQDHPFSPETVTQCEQIGLLIGPILEIRRKDERGLSAKIGESVYTSIGRLMGTGHLALKCATIVTALLIIWLYFAQGAFHISCDSMLEASTLRVIVAPQQGYIATANARAGDLVQEGDILATLDDQTLRFEQRKWISQHAQALKQYRKALAGVDRSEIAIFNSQRAQAEAQLELIDHQLSRTTLLAPFSGLVVKGDLSQSIGAPVTRGEVLYEIAPTNDYRVILNIDEQDIRLISTGQKGRLKLSGIPQKVIQVTVDRITPVSITQEGQNYFSVEALMENPSDLMRPGMEGITRIDIEEKRLIWIWTRQLVNWSRLFIWNRLP